MTENNETQPLITLGNKPAPSHRRPVGTYTMVNFYQHLQQIRDDTPIYDALRDEFDRAGIDL